MSVRTMVAIDAGFLARKRISCGFRSQTAAAKAAGVGLRTWCKAETKGHVSQKSAQLIARALGLSLPELKLPDAARRTQRPQDRILEAPGTYGPRNGADALAGPHAALDGDDHLRRRIERLTRMVSELAVENSDLKTEIERLKKGT